MTNMVFDCKVPDAIPQEGYGLIYLYTFDNGMMYVGQTSTPLPYRHKGHKHGHQMVDNYINTHLFRIDILGIFSHAELDDKERFFIEELNTLHPNGLNFETGGHENKVASAATLEKQSIVQTEYWSHPENRKMMSEKIKGKHPTEETRAKLREKRKNRVFTEETRKKISETHKGMRPTEETRKKLSESHKGKHLSEQAKAKLSAFNKGKKLTPEHIAKITAKTTGRKRTEEQCKRNSEAQKKKWQDPEYRAKMCKIRKEVLNRPEVRAKISATLKAKNKRGADGTH